MSDHRSHEQFITYYHQYKDKVFNYLMYRLNFNRPICEELLMDVVLKAYEKFHEFDEKKGAFKSWFLTIAHNHLINHWRKNKPVESFEDLEESGGVVPVTEMETGLKDQMNEGAIKTVLNLLSDQHKEVISLRYLSDLTYVEMSEVMGKKEGAIRTSLSRALDQFKSIYLKLYHEKN